jgi:hypothetical protein
MCLDPSTVLRSHIDPDQTDLLQGFYTGRLKSSKQVYVMMSTSILPGRYVQGDKAIDVLGQHCKRQRQRALVIVDRFTMGKKKEKFIAALGDEIEYELVGFAGECCDD